MDVERNPTMFGGNRFKLAVFGSNCSSGRAATTVPERWQNTFAENIRLAQMADAAGLECLVPIGRWKGYGGATNFEGSTFETITWACGLLAATQRLTVFGTVHVPLFPPVLAAKQIVTADHIGRGRFGLNIVCGWNQEEFDMFGLEQDGHDDRYARGQEWLEVLLRLWSEDAPFDYAGRYYQLKGVAGQPRDAGAIDTMLSLYLSPANQRAMTRAEAEQLRARYGAGYGGLLAVGDPDTVAGELKKLADAGFDGFCFSFVAYNDELPYFLQEVLPRLERMGLRQ